MSRRNNDAITIHSILSWIEDNLKSPLSLEKVSERPVNGGTCNVCLRKRPAIPLGQYIQPQADGDCAEAQAEQ